MFAAHASFSKTSSGRCWCWWQEHSSDCGRGAVRRYAAGNSSRELPPCTVRALKDDDDGTLTYICCFYFLIVQKLSDFGTDIYSPPGKAFIFTFYDIWQTLLSKATSNKLHSSKESDSNISLRVGYIKIVIGKYFYFLILHKVIFNQ